MDSQTNQPVNIIKNLKLVKDNISLAEQKAGRAPGSVKLLAVSKFHPQEAVIQAAQAGQILFGENRVQEAYKKFPQILEEYPQTQLHIIGQLQTNKVKHAVQIASCIESVDRIELIEEIEKHCSKIDKTIKILFEYHTGEESKSGFTEKEELIKALDLFKSGKFPHVIPDGFMTMAPFTEDKELIRKSFITLRELAAELQNKYPDFNLKELSMGMSGDYEIAIQEQSTLVRIGTSIFGQREY